MSKRQVVLVMFCCTGLGSAADCASHGKSPTAPSIASEEAQAAHIIYDTDMSLDVDDVGALALLHALSDRGEAEILGVMVSESMHSYDGLWGPPLVDVINTYYGRPNIPVGIYKGTASDIGYYGRFAEKVVKAGFPHDLLEAEQSQDSIRLYRKLLAEAPYRSVTVVSTGYLTNLQGLLLSGPDDLSPLTGTELVARKVIEWTCSGGRYPASGSAPELNFARYPDATGYVLANWPGKATFTGDELGQVYKAGGKLTNTFVLSANPVAMAWHHFNGGQAKESRDSAAVLYAVRGIASNSNSYFKKGRNGINQYEKIDGFTHAGKLALAQNTWVADDSQPHTYLMPAVATAPVTTTIDALITAAPAKATPLSTSRH